MAAAWNGGRLLEAVGNAGRLGGRVEGAGKRDPLVEAGRGGQSEVVGSAEVEEAAGRRDTDLGGKQGEAGKGSMDKGAAGNEGKPLREAGRGAKLLGAGKGGVTTHWNRHPVPMPTATWLF